MNLLATQQRNSLRPEGETGALIQTGIIGEEGVWRGIEITETTTMKEETNVVDVIVENIAQIEMRGGSYHQIDMEGGIKVQGRGVDRKDMETGLKIGRNILQMKAGGTLATGEGGARGP